MKFSIYTPSRQLLLAETVTSIFAPGVEGEINVLPEHADFLTALETGVLRWKPLQGDWQTCTISTGFLESFDGAVSVLSEVSELPNEVNVDRAKKAEQFAREQLENGGLDDENYRKYELKLERALARQSMSK